MNVRRLRRLARFVQKNAERYDQGEWCGTKACLAGHAAFLAGIKEEKIFNSRLFSSPFIKQQGFIEDIASRWLGLTSVQASLLFDGLTPPDNFPLFDRDLWPRKFADRYRKAKTDRARARVAADRIEHFIKSKGKE
jgi:hypothetical protein